MKKGKIILLIASLVQMLLMVLLTFDAFQKDRITGVTFGVFGIVVIIIVNIYLFTRVLNVIERAFVQENEKLALMQTEFSKIREENIEKQELKEAQFKKDMLSKIQDLKKIIDEKEYIQANQQIEEIQASWQTNPYYKIWCDNMLINVLLEEKQKIAREYSIDLKASLSIPENLSIIPTDLCSVFAKLIDNALEAAHMNEINDRKIRIKGLLKGGYLILKVENTFVPGLKKDKEHRVFKTRPGEVHGIGLKIIEKIVKKYDGKLILDHNDHTFSAVAYMKTEMTV